MNELGRTDRSRRERQLHDMITSTDGRAEIYRLARVIQGVKPHGSLSGMFIGQMIASILAREFPSLPSPAAPVGPEDAD